MPALKDVVIGLPARMRAGKGSFKAALMSVCRKDAWFPSISVISFSGSLRETLDQYDILPRVEHYQKLSECIFAMNPKGLVYATEKKIEKDTCQIKIVDGSRRLEEEKMIRRFGYNFLVGITATEEIRWQRCQKANSRAGDADITLEAFHARDNAPVEQMIDDIISRADCVIENNGTIEEYEEQIRVKFYEPHLKPLRLKVEKGE